MSSISAQTTYPEPVLKMPFTPGIMDATLKHLCLYSQSNATLKSKHVFNITYSEDRRGDAKCDSCCGTRTDGTSLNSRSCHQSPFAKTYEAEGIIARTGCVSSYENAFQGWWLGQWFRDIKLGRDTYFGDALPIRVEIEGLDCTGAREEDLDAVTSCEGGDSGRLVAKGVERRVIPPSIAQNTYHANYSLVIVPLGDLAPGVDYTLDVTITGNAFDVRLWDNVGDDLLVGPITPDDRNHVNLKFSGPRIGVGLMLATPDTDASIEWALSGTSSGKSNSASGLATKSLPPTAFPTSGSASTSLQSQTGPTGASGSARPSSSAVLSNEGGNSINRSRVWSWNDGLSVFGALLAYLV